MVFPTLQILLHLQEGLLVSHELSFAILTHFDQLLFYLTCCHVLSTLFKQDKFNFLSLQDRSIHVDPLNKIH